MSKPRLTFFCELEAAPLQVLFSLPDIAVLADLNATISMGILDLTPQRAEVVRRLNTAGIPLIAWLLLPKEEGYWFKLDNAPQAAARYLAFQKWTKAGGLQWKGIGLDIEPDIQDVEQIAKDKWRAFPMAASRIFHRRRLRRARKIYSQLVSQIRSDGYQIESYQLPFIVDERMARSTLLQRLAGLVDIKADREVLMLYSSLFRPFGPGFIWSYGRHAAAIGVGSTGGGVELEGIEQRPLDWQELARDLRLAWVFTGDIHIFSLEGCIKQGYLVRLRDFVWDVPIFDPIVQAVRVERMRASLRLALRIGSYPIVILGGLLALMAVLISGRKRLFR